MKVIRGTRTLLLQAGLPHGWWPCAPRFCIAIHNFVVDDEGSPCGHRHDGNAFIGPLLPFGALAHAVPSALHKKRNLRLEPALKLAMFLGYMLHDGSKCHVFVQSGRELKFDVGCPLDVLAVALTSVMNKPWKGFCVASRRRRSMTPSAAHSPPSPS